VDLTKVESSFSDLTKTSAVEILNEMLKTYPNRTQPKFGMRTSKEPSKEQEFCKFVEMASPTYAAKFR